MVTVRATLNTSHTFHRYGAEAARKAHNLEDTGSKPVAGIYHSQVYKNPPPLSLQQHFTGMAQWLARGAHNPEVIGSNPISGIYHLPVLQKLV